MERPVGEKLITSRAAFEGKLLSLTVDEVALTDGRRAVREVVHHPGAVAIVPLLAGPRVVMIRQYRHAAGKVLFELPAGIIGSGEPPEDCARRELMEETGYRAGELRLLFSTYLSPGYSTEIIHVFCATDLDPGAAAPEEDEEIEVMALPLEEAAAMVGNGLVENGAAICGILAVWREFQTRGDLAGERDDGCRRSDRRTNRGCD